MYFVGRIDKHVLLRIERERESKRYTLVNKGIKHTYDTGTVSCRARDLTPVCVRLDKHAQYRVLVQTYLSVYKQ